VTFQLWIRTLLHDGERHNRAHLIARLGPRTLRELYEQGVAPHVLKVAEHRERETALNAQASHARGSSGIPPAKAA
jgi:hypothetical protein